MTHQIRLEKYVSTKDGSGDMKEQITEKINTWAEITRSGGDRSSLNGQTGLTNFFIFRVRFNPKFNPSGNWRVIYDQRRFTPSTIEKEGQSRFWWIIKAEAVGIR